MTLLRTVQTEAAPWPSGHYIQGIDTEGLLFVSGQLPARADGTVLNSESFEIQARQALANLFSVVAAAGLSRDRVAKVTAFIVSVLHWPLFDALCAEELGSHKPARSVVPAPQLHHDCLIEIEAMVIK
jgi:2-iminobutanoate/2-iminopropanoate deaminase